ncbi:hypothetical protein RB195_010137 [Necator americanus]|uniref:Uncharacterized protein n=1 Tax=Necator americanus TaxID=51031 RepID=A0ABR1CZ21_NECAM
MANNVKKVPLLLLRSEQNFQCSTDFGALQGFMEQLQTFAGVLEASRHRHAPQFNGHETVPTVSGARAHSASCIRAPRRVSSATDSVRFIIREFELRRRGAEDPVRHSFPLDVISKRSSIQQIS